MTLHHIHGGYDLFKPTYNMRNLVTLSYIGCSVSMYFVSVFAFDDLFKVTFAVLAFYFLCASVFRKTLIRDYDLEKPRTEDQIEAIMDRHHTTRAMSIIAFFIVGLMLLISYGLQDELFQHANLVLAILAFIVCFGFTQWIHYKRWQKRFPEINIFRYDDVIV